MQAASDSLILARAVAEDRIVVSADTEFGAILANQEANRPSFILFRDPNLMTASDYAEALLRALVILEPELISGCVAEFRNGRCGFENCRCPDHSAFETSLSVFNQKTF